MGITVGIKPPMRSRTFTEQDARDADAALKKLQTEGKTGEGVGFGLFNSAESARSAGAALNKMIVSLGLSTVKWSTTVFKVEVPTEVPDPENEGQTIPGDPETKYQGVMLPKAAKPAPARKAKAAAKKK